MKSFRIGLSCVSALGLATTTSAQISILNVNRYLTSTSCTRAQSNGVNVCDSGAESDTSAGAWTKELTFSSDIDGGADWAFSNTRAYQVSNTTPESITIYGCATAELASAGSCYSSAIAESFLSVTFRVHSPRLAVLVGKYYSTDGEALSIILRKADGQILYIYGGDFQATYTLIPGDYNYIVRAITDDSCAGLCRNQSGAEWYSALIFEWLPCPADLNGDTFVDDSDFVVFAAAYNELLCPGNTAPCPADFNGDEMVEDADFVVFAAAYNELLCP